MLAKFIAQIDLVLNSKQWTYLNKACHLVTRLMKFYPQDKRPKGRRCQKAKLFETRHEVPRRNNDKGRNQNHVTRSMWTVTYWWRKRKRIFCMLRGSEINSYSKQQLILTDQPLVRTTMGNILWENAIYRKIMDRWVKNWNWKWNLSSKTGEKFLFWVSIGVNMTLWLNI